MASEAEQAAKQQAEQSLLNSTEEKIASPIEEIEDRTDSISMLVSKHVSKAKTQMEYLLQENAKVLEARLAKVEAKVKRRK
jgi:hypothetical protein